MTKQGNSLSKIFRERLVVLVLSACFLMQVSSASAQVKARQSTSTAGRSTASPLRLRGQVSELMMLCNAAGISLDDKYFVLID